jgi:hypothetical protein
MNKNCIMNEKENLHTYKKAQKYRQIITKHFIQNKELMTITFFTHECKYNTDSYTTHSSFSGENKG